MPPGLLAALEWLGHGRTALQLLLYGLAGADAAWRCAPATTGRVSRPAAPAQWKRNSRRRACLRREQPRWPLPGRRRWSGSSRRTAGLLPPVARLQGQHRRGASDALPATRTATLPGRKGLPCSRTASASSAPGAATSPAAGVHTAPATARASAATGGREAASAAGGPAAASGTATATPRAARAAPTSSPSCLARLPPRLGATRAPPARRSVTQRRPRRSAWSLWSSRPAACPWRSWPTSWR